MLSSRVPRPVGCTVSTYHRSIRYRSQSRTPTPRIVPASAFGGRRWPPSKIVRLRGLPVTSPLRTAVDLGSERVLVNAVIALDMALHKRIVDLTQLRSFCKANRGAKRIAKLRRAIELTEPATESPMETRLRMLLVMASMPRPCAQVPLHNQQGRFLGRPDLYYPEHKLGLEYDGGTHRESLVEDNRRQNRLLNGGIRLLRFTAADIYGTPESVIEQVRLAMGKKDDSQPSHLAGDRQPGARPRHRVQAAL